MTTYEGETLRRSGPPEELLRRLNPHAVDGISLETEGFGGGRRHHVGVDLGRETCSLTVEGSDPLWVTGVAEQVASEISLGVPRWHHVRTDWASNVIVLFVLGALGILEVTRIGGLWAFAVFAVTGFPLGVVILWALDRLSPIFELTKSDRGRGRRSSLCWEPSLWASSPASSPLRSETEVVGCVGSGVVIVGSQGAGRESDFPCPSVAMRPGFVEWPPAAVVTASH